MNPRISAALQAFKNEVGIKFQLYNSLFSSLPFHRIEKTGIHLALLLSNAEEGLAMGRSPVEVLDEFFAKHTPLADEAQRLDIMFRFVQYAERQVVLFDALEDAAFTKVNDMNGPGTLKALQTEVAQHGLESGLRQRLGQFGVRLVLTAHPTQFYPGEVLGIINDLSHALAQDNATLINTLLMQLGKTPFFKQEKPTPYHEAVSLVWYLENVFYAASGQIVSALKAQFPSAVQPHNPLIVMGFWPGGDRDGNPFVVADTTLQVAELLRTTIMKCYYREVRQLRRRLTFKGVTQPLAQLEKQLYDHIFMPGHQSTLSAAMVLSALRGVVATLHQHHNGLMAHLAEALIDKVELFGLFFASLDVRQESSVHGRIMLRLSALGHGLPQNYLHLSEAEKMDVLGRLDTTAEPHQLADAVEADTLRTAQAMRVIQQQNGETGCHRFIISQTNSALNVMEVYGLLKLAGWPTSGMAIDIVPLFETIEDLNNASHIMRALYEHPAYSAHLRGRHSQQTIMLGFSDGTKDGGYLMANFGIYKAKEQITALSRAYQVDVVFFDGRGGPPSRGGGKTHKFYASMGQNIANNQIQITVQGQTVSSNFGTIDAAQFNIEQLIHAGISSHLEESRLATLAPAEEELLFTLAQNSFDAYLQLRNHPNFFDYLGHASPLRFYAAANIGSRPAKRSAAARLSLADLRAIPYVGSWAQLKQNVTGYYGVGTALKMMETTGRWAELKALHQASLFFRTLIENSEMAMKKTCFPLTAHLADHPVYGKVWQMIHQEYLLSRQMVQQLTGRGLMDNYPVEQLSVEMRERIVLPLTTIQQYAITKVRQMEEQVMQSPLKPKYEKLVMRCSFGIINAGRNSV
jgi:phosphoenolpyruvate carboxylase